MIQTVEATIAAVGQVRLLGAVQVDGPRHAFVTVLEEPAMIPGEAALLAEATTCSRRSSFGAVPILGSIAYQVTISSSPGTRAEVIGSCVR